MAVTQRLDSTATTIVISANTRAHATVDVVRCVWLRCITSVISVLLFSKNVLYWRRLHIVQSLRPSLWSCYYSLYTVFLTLLQKLLVQTHIVRRPSSICCQRMLLLLVFAAHISSPLIIDGSRCAIRSRQSLRSADLNLLTVKRYNL